MKSILQIITLVIFSSTANSQNITSYVQTEDSILIAKVLNYVFTDQSFDLIRESHNIFRNNVFISNQRITQQPLFFYKNIIDKELYEFPKKEQDSIMSIIKLDSYKQNPVSFLDSTFYTREKTINCETKLLFISVFKNDKIYLVIENFEGYIEYPLIQKCNQGSKLLFLFYFKNNQIDDVYYTAVAR